MTAMTIVVMGVAGAGKGTVRTHRCDSCRCCRRTVGRGAAELPMPYLRREPRRANNVMATGQ